MRRYITLAVFPALILVLGIGVTAALAQIATVNPTPPPCSGEHCVNLVRGARIEHHGAASIAKAACPAGTVYDARKGTCHVLSIGSP